MSMTIAKLASAGGVGVETVRYYQRRGLLSESARPDGGVRRYGDDDVRRLCFIRLAQAAGFTLGRLPSCCPWTPLKIERERASPPWSGGSQTCWQHAMRLHGSLTSAGQAPRGHARS